MLDNWEACIDTVRIQRLEECTNSNNIPLHSRRRQVGYSEGNHSCNQINRRRITVAYKIRESKGNWWVGSSTPLLPWVSQALTIGMVPINLRHCLLSSSLFRSLTSNFRSELGRSSTFGSDRMAGQLLITSVCSELGRHSLGIDRMAGQSSISNSCSESGRPSLGSDRMAAQPQMSNLLRLRSLCSPAGRHCSLPHSQNPILSREVRSWRASSCPFVKRSTSSSPQKRNSVSEEESKA